MGKSIVNNPMKNKKNIYWNIGGIIIFLVVLTQCLYEIHSIALIRKIVDIISMVHIPVLVFIAGCVENNEKSRSILSIIQLGFLYFIMNSIMGFVYGFELLLEPVYSCWYLLALVVWRIVTPSLTKFKNIVLLLVAISLFAGFYSSIDNTFAIGRIISFYPFYMAGHLFNEKKIYDIHRMKVSKRFLFGGIAFIGTIASGFVACNFLGYSDTGFLMEGYVESIEVIGRGFMFLTAFLAIGGMIVFSVDKNIPFVTMIGRNSNIVFLLHIPSTLLFIKILEGKKGGVVATIIYSLVICLVLGNDVVARWFYAFTKAGADIFTQSSNKKKGKAEIWARVTSVVVALCFVGKIVIKEYDGLLSEQNIVEEVATEESEDTIFRIMDEKVKSKFDNAFHITFAGDLILLEDQVKRGKIGVKYDFSEVFKYATSYISEADLAIGVFEGPMAGEKVGYSSSNFDDNKKLALNYPDEYAEAVKNAGFDLVTTANNHLLDKGMEGANRTLDILDKIGLEHVGSYRNNIEKENSHIKIIHKDGIKFVVLSYTYGSNGYTTEELADGYVTSIISGTEGELFEKLKSNVQSDFREAKSYSPDLIIVLPHMGTQFSNEIDSEQKVWFEIFKECGADIILGDHAHAVQPALIEKYGDRTVFSAYCPGNFANQYREKQGDASALIDIYIDRTTKEVIGGGIVPMYTQSTIAGNYRALPIYEIQYNEALRNQLSTDDFENAKVAHNAVMKAALQVCPDVSGITKRYFFDEKGYIRTKTAGLKLTEEMKNGVLFSKLKAAKTICFVGDSITEGTKNGGCPWYEPIEEYILADVKNFSKGGATVSYLIEQVEKIPETELYVIAIGTNDVRYRDEAQCAMSAESYANSIEQLRSLILKQYPKAKFVFIAPWYSIDGDPFCPLSYEDKAILNKEYSSALENSCTRNGDLFVNPNDYIKKHIDLETCGFYLMDHIHPNSSRGVRLYSEAVLVQK